MNNASPGTDMVFANASLKDRMDWSRAIAGAGALVPAGFRDGNNPNPAKILLAVEYGAMLGLHPMAALSGIHVIDGKPTLSAALMSAQVHKAGHKLRIVSTGTVTGTGTTMGGDFAVTVTLVRADDPKNPFTSVWTIDRAKRAGLWGKGNWQKYPETQMTWRGVSEVTKLGAPEVLSGVWYTPDELGATVNEDGDVIDAEEVEQDHDGPNVTATMRETKPSKGTVGARGRDSEREVSTRANEDSTPSGAQRPGGSRPTNKPAAGTTDTRDKATVFNEWSSRIDETTTFDALVKLHAEAADRNVLDHRAAQADGGSTSLEDVFVTRREEIIGNSPAVRQQAQASEPVLVPDVEEYPDDTPF